MQTWVRREFLVSIALAVSLMVSSVPVIAQQDDGESGRIDGEQAARADVSKKLWLAVGCFGGVIGCVVASKYMPSPPAAKLLGRPPEYVAAYTDAYKGTARGIQSRTAKIGCVTRILLGFLILLTLDWLE